MRRALLASLAVMTVATALPAAAQAQVPGQTPGQRDRPTSNDETLQRDRAPRIAPLRRQPNAGPCPYVKILYDAARFVEIAGDGRAAASNVGYTGEIEGLSAGCAYQSDEPITVHVDLLFNLGRGPQAQGDTRTYRYWIAVTERNRAVLAKEYFDLPVNFEGADRTSVTEERVIVIPRAGIETSGANFEVLVGFDVTPDMAEFNRSGSRFRVTAGQSPAPAATPPAQ